VLIFQLSDKVLSQILKKYNGSLWTGMIWPRFKITGRLF
jgi:hypothetical protein